MAFIFSESEEEQDSALRVINRVKNVFITFSVNSVIFFAFENAFYTQRFARWLRRFLTELAPKYSFPNLNKFFNLKTKQIAGTNGC